MINVGTQLRAKQVPSPARGTAHEPELSGDLIVWSGDFKIVDPSELIDNHLFVHDLAKKTTQRITTKRYGFAAPQISGNVIVWRDFNQGLKNDAVYYCIFDARTGQCPAEKIASGRDLGGSVVVAGKRIVWDESVVKDGLLITRLSTYDLETNKEEVLAEQSAFRVDISKNYMVWMGRGIDQPLDIFLYNFETKTQRQITNTPEDEFFPKISGNTVVYLRRFRTPEGNFAFQDLHSYDITSGTDQLLLHVFPDSLINGDFSDGRLVWPGIAEIRMYDLATNMLHGLVIKPIVPLATPAISGNKVVWINVADFINGTGDVHYAKIPRK
ncbi:hypothetical protein L0222_00645 [bacterium]|nr:hypothetical protein [bacterium]MCI0606551.1 hypothetical protein [bacterium]